MHCSMASSSAVTQRTAPCLLLVILHFRVSDAAVFRIPGHRIALLLGDLVVGVHLVFACIGHRCPGLAFRLGVSGCLDMRCLGFLHADILVIALAGLAGLLGSLVVGVSMRDGLLVRGFALCFIGIGGLNAAGKRAQRRCQEQFSDRKFHGPTSSRYGKIGVTATSAVTGVCSLIQ